MADHLTFSSTERKILESCAAAMDGLALYLGEGYEFVLHSLEDLSHSVVKIINGHYSNRKPGAPITDFGMNLLRDLEQKQKPEPQVYFNYQNGTLLKSTTIPILGDNGRMIAMLCINFHTDIPMATFLSGFFPAGSPSPLPQRSETFSDNVDHFIHAALDQAKATVFADPRISSVNRNKEIIRLVHEQGIFKMKNAVPKVAQELGVSKNTVYLHLRSLKNADQGEEP